MTSWSCFTLGDAWLLNASNMIKESDLNSSTPSSSQLFWLFESGCASPSFPGSSARPPPLHPIITSNEDTITIMSMAMSMATRNHGDSGCLCSGWRIRCPLLIFAKVSSSYLEVLVASSCCATAHLCAHNERLNDGSWDQYWYQTSPTWRTAKQQWQKMPIPAASSCRVPGHPKISQCP